MILLINWRMLKTQTTLTTANPITKRQFSTAIKPPLNTANTFSPRWERKEKPTSKTPISVPNTKETTHRIRSTSVISPTVIPSLKIWSGAGPARSPPQNVQSLSTMELMSMMLYKELWVTAGLLGRWVCWLLRINCWEGAITRRMMMMIWSRIRKQQQWQLVFTHPCSITLENMACLSSVSSRTKAGGTSSLMTGSLAITKLMGTRT